MAKIKLIKRVVYRKHLSENGTGEIFIKIYPEKSAITVELEDLFSFAKIEKTKNIDYFNKKDKKKVMRVIRKKEFIKAYRTARKTIKI